MILDGCDRAIRSSSERWKRGAEPYQLPFDSKKEGRVVMISSAIDLEKARAELPTMTNEQLLDEAALYDAMAVRESEYQNWYAVDLFADANRMFLGEYYDRIEQQVAKAAAAEARKRKAASTIGQRIPKEVREQLIALRAVL